MRTWLPRRTALLALLFAAPLACSAGPDGATGQPQDNGGDDAGSSAPTGPTGGGTSDAGSSHPSPPTGDAGSAPAPDAGPVGTTDAGHADAGAPGTDSGGPTPPASDIKVVAYLPNYSGSYADWANNIDFTKMTHMNLAFASANGSNDWDMGASDSDVGALVSAAHAAGVKVIASLGGGGGDQSVIAQFKDAGNVPALVDNLDSFLKRLNLDGADIDIEDPSHLGDDYGTFVDAVVAKLHPEGKLVTAAVAQYLQDSMSDHTLHEFDFVNVMVYSNYNDGVDAMNYYSGTKSVPKTQIVLGVGFFGTDSGGNEYAYSDIMKADSNAWSKDQAQVNGNTVNYTGVATTAKIAQYAKGYGGVMFWELSEDTTDSHSLYKAIQSAM
ncbi:MAG TPA: glycosyl hydrolase family 18 protein [Polyangiaceae bacterium]|jgi:GH18 family chitinase